jgi:hypothetical protein
MANEAHNGPARCIRTREMGVRVIRAAHAGEVHYDGNGTFGEDLDVAFRLLDAPRFKAELKHASVPLAVVAFCAVCAERSRRCRRR